MEQWYMLYVFSYSYEFVIWPDFFVGYPLSWWFLPRIWSPVTDMQQLHFAKYPTDDWHQANVFSQVYFSVLVCLRRLYYNSVINTARVLCQFWHTPHTGLPFYGKHKTKGAVEWCPVPIYKLGQDEKIGLIPGAAVVSIQMDSELIRFYFLW